MGIVFRQSVITTIISYCGVAIGYINLLYLYPKFLEPDQIGLMRTIQDAAILFTPFAQFGLAQSILRYYPRLVTTKASSGSFIKLMLLLALVGFSIFFLLFKIFEAPILSYFQTNAQEIIGYSSLVLWLTLILLLMAIFEAYSRSLLKTVVPNLLREIVARLLLAVLVLLYFAGYIDFNQFIISTALAYLLCLTILMLYLWTQGELQLRHNFDHLNKGELPGLIKYSLLSFAGMAGLIIIGKVDSIMVTGLMGLTANAVYTTAFYMATVIEIPKRALMQIAMPLISRAFEKNDMADIRQIYQKTSINQFIVGGLILIGIWANLHNIFALMPKGEIYEAGKYVVMIVGLGKLLDMLFGPSSEIIVLSKYYSFNILLILLLAVSIVMANNLLIPLYGIDGAAIGSALALILFNLLKYIFIYAKLKMQPFTLSTLKVLAIVLVAVGCNCLIPRMDMLLADLILRSSIITLVYGSLIIFSKASPDGNSVFRKVLIYTGITKS
ncbi:MAG TPA: polysaccharide biosynthesis protein [Cytophagales bacterium]|nr:polysaccharide biosynthesis protein [Cytophagales bacterium]HCR53083.1 polysaccharide biosynthesis protein [Cytophagales bacterium]